MALDTASKRASALGVALVSVTLVVPLVGIEQGDRQTIGSIYSGILVDAPVIVTPDCITALEGVISSDTLALGGIINPDAVNIQGIIQENTDLMGKLCC